jgi:hypothetical protein
MEKEKPMRKSKLLAVVALISLLAAIPQNTKAG